MSWWSIPRYRRKRLPEFIAYAKANPGKINMGSAGIGTPPHAFGELFKMMAGVDMVHVPSDGSYVPDLLSGQVQVVFAPIPTVIAQVRAGQIARARGHHGQALGGAAGRAAVGDNRAGL